MNVIGIDNGVTGTYCVVGPDNSILDFGPIPVVTMQDWTKAKKKITRIDFPSVIDIFHKWRPSVIGIERPLHNARMFTATVSGARALESVLIAIEVMDIPYSIISARDWQKQYISGGLGGTKARSMARAITGNEAWREAIQKHGDCDSYFIARFARDYERPQDKN